MQGSNVCARGTMTFCSSHLIFQKTFQLPACYVTFPDTVFCKSSILSFISGLERCHVRILFHWDTGNPCSFSFVVFWFVRQINCEMNIKREIEASVINHLLALSLCQCHYTHAHTHTREQKTHTHVSLYQRPHMFLWCVQWRNSETKHVARCNYRNVT